MKALLVCSIHALLDLSEIELRACNSALTKNGIATQWNRNDYARIVETAPLLHVLNRLPHPKHVRASLIEDFLEILNEDIWNLDSVGFESVRTTLAEAHAKQVKKGFVSEYPMLTTNLVRSTALRTHATKLGELCAPSNPMIEAATATGLATIAASLGVSHCECDVMVACQRDYVTAMSLGMNPKIVDEAQNHDKFRAPPQHKRNPAADQRPNFFETARNATTPEHALQF